MINSFDSEYQKLNSDQKLAVDTTDGPVMVVAGAGTGKTQTIALRIANILQKTQIGPSNILCLTFTDSAAINMRQRLSSIIGPDAYSVRISTFHSFCQSIIKHHPEHFLQFHSDSEALDKIEQIQIIQSLIDKLPPNSPLTSSVEIYYAQNQIISAIESLKKESISSSVLADLINQSSQFLQSAASCYQQLKTIRADKKNLNQIIDIVNKLIKLPNINSTYQTKISSLVKDHLTSAKEIKTSIICFYENCQKNLPKQQSLLWLFIEYQQQLSSRHLFDFDDMILSVIDLFKNKPEILAEYQERFQYILVDEYQDTNSSQNQIIDLLAGSDFPNVFVVGDDDQSIFRFQGASTENVYHFYLRYHPQLVVLRNNYRSHRLILASSQTLINRNLNRIATKISNIDKTLIASRDYDPDPINFYVAQSNIEENYCLASSIKKLTDTGVDPNHIAVLVRNNADIDDLLPALSSFNIKYTKDFSINILLQPPIIQLIDLLRLLSNPTDSILFGKVLNFQFLNFPAIDLYRHFHQQPTSDKFVKRLDRFTDRLAKFQKQKLNLPPDRLFNRLIRRFGYLKWVLRCRNLELLKQLDRLYQEFKVNYTDKRLTFDQIVSRLSTHFDSNLSLNCPPLLSESVNCVRLMTIHKAKGLEFDHVFLPKALASRWEDARGRQSIPLPLGIIASEVIGPNYDQELEENRRLFYVALTRAKNQIYLSYTQNNPEGRELLPTRFIAEIDPKNIQTFPTDPNIESSALKLQFSMPNTKLFSTQLSDYLRWYFANKYRLNITHLNSYQKCPLCFFFKTILKIPQAKTIPLSYGTSVHGALAYLFSSYKRTDSLIPLNQFLNIFQNNLVRENLPLKNFDELLTRGRQQLTEYYQHYQSNFSGRCLVEHDFRPYLARIDDIPITGKVDKIEIISGRKVNVVDFKTGKPDNKYHEISREGDYFRQLVFYKILADHSPGFNYQVVSGSIDFIQTNSRNQFVRRDYDITPSDISSLTSIIKDTYQKVISLNFSQNPSCPDHDHLHHLASKYFFTCSSIQG